MKFNIIKCPIAVILVVSLCILIFGNTVQANIGWTEHTIDGDFNGASSVYATDVDGDGDTDVLGAAWLGHYITWWRNDGGSPITWTEYTIKSNFYNASSVYATDVDGDGDTDILGAAAASKDITWWRNDGGSPITWTEYTIEDIFDGANSVYATDVDGDGDTDVLGAAFHADDITWWRNDGGSPITWTEYTIDGNFDYAYSVYATDVDGDGDTDVLGAAADADDITWWRNDGGSPITWTEYTIEGDFDAAWSVYATDIDGDGDTDVLGAAAGADDITWWRNDGGSPITWTEYTIDGDFDGAYSVYATDVDGNGDTDVLGAATNADDITWWESGPPPVAPPPPPPPPPPSPSPPSEVAVGVDIYPVDKIALLAPWIALSVAILAGFALVIAYRKARA